MDPFLHFSFIMSEADFSSLPISKMRSTLKALGLSGAGTKVEMLERYREYLSGNNTVPDLQNAGDAESTIQEQEEIENTPEVPKVDADESVPVAEGAVPSEQTEDGTQQPGEEISGETIPSGDVPAESVPDNTMPSENVPDSTVPAESVPDNTVPSESVPPETTPVESVPAELATAENVSAEPVPSESASAETNPPVTAPITPEATPSEASLDFDIEAELDKREMRSKKFGTAFDRELCRQQLLREHSGATAVQFTVDRTADSDRERRLLERQAKFGSTDWSKRAERRQRFDLAGSGSGGISAELRSERQKKFGIVEPASEARQSVKRYRSSFRNRKYRRY